ncbi:MAG: hypothetical protein ACKVOK_00095 [Flavobacteriales bacterium]
MKEDDFIDELFRSNLTHQDIPVDGHALNEAMKMLDARKKKNVRVIYWISGLLGLLAIGVGLAFFFCSTENYTNDPNIETTSPSSLPSSSPQRELADSSTNGDNGSIKTNSAGPDNFESAEQKDKSIEAANANVLTAQKSSIRNAAGSPDNNKAISEKSYKKETWDIQMNGSEENSESQIGLNQLSQDQILSHEQKTNDQSIQKAASSAKMRDSDTGTTAMLSGVNYPEHVNPDSEANQTASPLTDIPRTDEIPAASALKSDSVSVAENNLDSTKNVEDLLKPDFKKRGFSKWDMRLAGSGFYTYSTIGQRNLYEDVYAQQRNQQETSLTGYGLDVSMSRTNERSFVSLGLGYLQTREDIQYEATKTEQEITSEEYWEYESVLYMIVDGTGTNQNNIIWDTTFMVVDVDSTLYVTYDTTTTTTENTAITAFNGAAKWSHLYLPLVYGVRLDHKTKSSLYAVGSLEFDYLTSSTAHYLASDGQSVKAMTEFPGYRRFMINGSVGIEWRKLLGGERMYLLVNPGIRSNLYSWNADFKHNTFSPFVRAGIGWRFHEK